MSLINSSSSSCDMIELYTEFISRLKVIQVSKNWRPITKYKINQSDYIIIAQIYFQVLDHGPVEVPAAFLVFYH